MQSQGIYFQKTHLTTSTRSTKPTVCRFPVSSRCQQKTVVCAQHLIGGATGVLQEKNLKTELSPEDGQELEAMDWSKCWYAVALVEDLEPKKPTPVKLLGRDFVLWRDVNKEWKCFQDACPHRLAPLSEGRIEPSDGSLMCSYHGWRFQSDGECTRIPQAIDGGVSSGCKNPRSRAKAFPVQIASNVVWIWPDASESSFIDSTMSSPYGLDADENDKFIPLPNYVRDLDYPFDILIENIMDPSHVAFAHHGVQGRRGDRDRMEAQTLKMSGSPKSLFFKIEDIRNADQAPEKQKIIKRTLEYSAPDYISYKYVGESEGDVSRHMIVHATPTSSTTCRAISRMYWTKPTSPLLSIILNLFMMRKWFNHLYSHLIFDGDTILLNQGAQNLKAAETSGKSWKTEYFMPAACDIPATVFRRWFHGKFAAEGPKFAKGDSHQSTPAGNDSRRHLLDRYHTHTKHCKACQGALRYVKILKAFTQGALFTSMIWSLAIIRSFWNGQGGMKLGMAVWAVGLLGLGFLAHFLGKIETYFYFKDYEHWKT